MTCPDLDRLVDDAVAGLPGAPERLAAHADACAACIAEADCAHAPVPELALLAGATCPPDVLATALAAAALAEAALAEAARAEPVRSGTARPEPVRATRLASDCPAERPAAHPSARPSARPVWTRRVAAGLAFAAALLALRAVWPSQSPETPQVAATPPVSPPVLGAEPTAEPVEVAAATPAPAAMPATRAVATPAARTAELRASPRPPADGPASLAPAAPDSAQVPVLGPAFPDDDLATATPADSAAARSDLLLALAIVGRAQRTADDAVSAEMRRVSDALEPARTL